MKLDSELRLPFLYYIGNILSVRHEYFVFAQKIMIVLIFHSRKINFFPKDAALKYA